LNNEGVVASNSDELEGRLPSGDANLCTSSLYYDALNSSAYLAKILEEGNRQASDYKKQAEKIKVAIEKYFGGTIDGFKTYKYYKGNDTLRAWICIPLTMGIYDRAAGTIDALFSARLWTADGLASIAGERTFWDRSTLYALRGVLSAGATDKALNFLHSYSERRLLGDHVPYPVEAYPEGDQRHLSAESGLYCRIFTEGLFGIRPTGLHSFKLLPMLPSSWNSMSLRHIYAFKSDIDIMVRNVDTGIHISVTNGGKNVVDKTIRDGDEIDVRL
jgi:hypothetical protein